MKIMTTAILNKAVVSTKGENLGIVENLVAETKNGNIESIIINPNDEISREKLNKDGKLVIPFKNIKAIRDVVVIEVEK